jgi:hypothetical protein
MFDPGASCFTSSPMTGRTVILTCGNPSLMANIKYFADSNQIRFEKEDW